MAEIKGNSFKSRQEKAETNPVKSKPQAKAKVKEKTFKQKVKDAFIAEDVVDIKEYLVFKVGIPGIKKMLRNSESDTDRLIRCIAVGSDILKICERRFS